MKPIGTPLSPSATRVMLLGSGELGKEVAIELQRLGVEVIGVDRYADAPAMQVAHRSHVVTMTDADALRAVARRLERMKAAADSDFAPLLSGPSASAPFQSLGGPGRLQ